MKYKGFVLWWNKIEGTGFVRSYNRSHPDLFLHYSSLPGSTVHTHVDIKDYTPIDYDIVDGFMGPMSQAHNIKVLDGICRTTVVSDCFIRLLDSDEWDWKDICILNHLHSIKKIGRECGYSMHSSLFDFKS